MKSSAPMMFAPGAAASSMHLPGSSSRMPSIEDHLVVPETPTEMIRGRLIQVMPAHPPHADRNARIDYVLSAHVADGYIVATDLLTRAAVDSDFASDCSIRQEGTDPRTGVRYLEEIAFEIVNTQSLTDVTEKADDLYARGVRRVFAVFVKRAPAMIKEWDGSAWQALSPQEAIVDRLFVRPVPVRSLLDAAEADAAVVRALAAKKSPELVRMVEGARRAGLEEGHDAGHRAGAQQGARQMLLTVVLTTCEDLGVRVTKARKAFLEGLELQDLHSLWTEIRRQRAWPK